MHLITSSAWGNKGTSSIKTIKTCALVAPNRRHIFGILYKRVNRIILCIIFKGTEIIRDSVRNMDPDCYNSLASDARVGLFTDEDETTIFPEYWIYRDTPECAGTLT